LLPGAETFTGCFARDGKLFLYAVASRGKSRFTVSFGENHRAPQAALKVPFAFPLSSGGDSVYDFSRDLSTIVYARPGGHADLYILSQKQI
jgi:hypothetical protein